MVAPTMQRADSAVAQGTTWRIDPLFSSIDFSVKHMKIATVHGHFAGPRGTIRFDQTHPQDAKVEVEIDAATQVLPVLGSREALFAFAQAVVDGSRPAAPVLMPNPCYQIYEGAALLAGATPWYVNADPDRGFALDWDAVPTPRRAPTTGSGPAGRRTRSRARHAAASLLRRSPRQGSAHR